MSSLPRFSRNQIALNALVVAICLSVSFGGSARLLMPSLAVSANDGSRAEVPLHSSSAPEESPAESPDSSQLAKEVEAASCAMLRKSQKKVRFSLLIARAIGAASDQSYSEPAILAGSQTDKSLFEYGLRNGCGAHLRC